MQLMNTQQETVISLFVLAITHRTLMIYKWRSIDQLLTCENRKQKKNCDVHLFQFNSSFGCSSEQWLVSSHTHTHTHTHTFEKTNHKPHRHFHKQMADMPSLPSAYSSKKLLLQQVGNTYLEGNTCNPAVLMSWLIPLVVCLERSQ